MTNPDQQQQMLAEGSEAADFIRTSIVQAAMNDRGAFGEHAHCFCCGCHAHRSDLAMLLCSVGFCCRRGLNAPQLLHCCSSPGLCPAVRSYLHRCVRACGDPALLLTAVAHVSLQR